MVGPRKDVRVPAATNSPRRSPWSLVIFGGVLAGALDITYACVFWALKAGVSPLRILQSVAAGALGQASFSGGVPTAALGLVLHFFIALSMAAAYFAAALRIPLLAKRPLACGPVYGLVLYLFMNRIVVPLSRAGGPSSDPLWVALTVIVHIVLIGLPIAIYSGRAASVVRGHDSTRDLGGVR